jgi:hypothetical protein
MHVNCSELTVLQPWLFECVDPEPSSLDAIVYASNFPFGDSDDLKSKSDFGSHSYATPGHLVTGLITERGVCEAKLSELAPAIG